MYQHNNMEMGVHLQFLIIYVGFLWFLNSEKINPEIVSLHITSDIKYRFATTLVSSKVANRNNFSVEARFEVTIPDAAFITDFVMEIDGKLYQGEINEKQKAKEKYEEAKKKGQSAGHVSQKPRHTSRFNVEVNVANHSTVTFNLTYQELLERVYGEYEHIIYIDPGQIVKDFQINIAIQESRELTKVSVPPLRNDVIQDSKIEEGVNSLVTIDRPSPKSAYIHYAPTVDDQKLQSDQGINGLFVVEYDIQRNYDAGEVLVVDGYFVYFFAPDGLDPIPKDVLFILDVSGSMSGTKIRQQTDAMRRILQDLHESDRFNIVEFSTHSNLWQPTILPATSENIEKARDYADQTIATGMTDINTAILTGIDFLNKVENGTDRMKIVLFLTDGQATSGEANRDQILKNIDNKNTKDLSVFSLAFGDDADYQFVKKVAVKNKGVARKIYEDSDAALQIKGFYNEISSSTLRNVSFKYLDETSEVILNATRLNFDNFFDGKEIVIAGKLPEDVGVVNLVVTGNGVDGNIQLESESNIASSVPELTKSGDFGKITERIWSYLTIKQLLEKAIGEDDPIQKKALNNRALELSLKYKFVTPLTSMVVTKPEKSDVGEFEENEDASLARSTTMTKLTDIGYGPTDLGRSFDPSIPQHLISYGNIPNSNSRSAFGPPDVISGGAGGDPHFMLRIKDLELPVCFNINTRNGDVLRLLGDPVLGITINAGIIASTIKNKHGDFKTFIGKLVLFSPSVQITVDPYNIIFNGAALSWDDHHVFRMLGVEIHVKNYNLVDKIVTIDLAKNVVVTIRRHMKEGHHFAMSYLNINMDDETGVSSITSGILGEFIHKTTKLIQVTEDTRGKHGHFVHNASGKSHHFYTTLLERPDTITGKQTKCWTTHQDIEAILMEKHFVNDINSVVYFPTTHYGLSVSKS